MPDNPTLAITLDGESYNIDLADLTAADAKDFRHAVGVSLAQVMQEQSADLDVVAGLIWLVRRRRERGLSYDKVARTITYQSDVDVAEGEPEVDPGPET